MSTLNINLNNVQPLDTILTGLSGLAYSGNQGLFIKVNATADGFEFAAGSGGGGSTFADNLFQVYDNADNTKILAFEASGITTGTTRTLTIPNASGTIALTSDLASYVPYTGASGNVDLGTHTILAHNATIASSGSGDTSTINHTSGSGIALNITKGGNGEGLYINKTSGSGNAATIIGTLNATTLVKSGGTSSQFLKADGTVDSTAYGLGSVTSVVALTLGTTGTDLSSTVANGTTTPVITLNVPTASAANRGALSSTDWSTFNGKQDALVSGTSIKTVNSTSLLGSGDVAVQATLVSGTNIKTINSTSILGSGNLVVAPTPSGVAGAVQFSNGSAFASDATNFFWDDANNRLGIGTASPTDTLHNTGTTRLDGLLKFLGTTSAFPALKRNSTELQVRLADDSAFAPIQALGGTFNSRINIFQTDILVTNMTTAVSKSSFIGGLYGATELGVLMGAETNGFGFIQGRYSNTAEQLRMQVFGNGISIGSSTGTGWLSIGSIDQLALSRLGIPIAPTASANYGLVSLGSGAFNGSTSGFFTGVAAGTVIAVNLASGGTSDLLNMQVAGVTRFKVSSAGKPTYDSTITAGGTTGNQTINKPSGTVNVAAAGTDVTVTNNLVTTSSIVTAVVRTNDSTAYIKNVVPSAGSFVITLGAAATAETSIGFIVNN